MSEPIGEFTPEEDFNEEDFYVPEDPTPEELVPVELPYEEILDFTARVMPYSQGVVEEVESSTDITPEMQDLLDQIAELRRQLESVQSYVGATEESSAVSDATVAEIFDTAWTASQDLQQATADLSDLAAQTNTIREDLIAASGYADEIALDVVEAFNKAADAERDASEALEKVKNSAAIVKIDSSRGVLFKQNEISTVLKVSVFRGDKLITDIVDLSTEFGVGSYLEWQWQKMDESTFGTISAADPRIGAGGFTLTLTPNDVDSKVVFRCVLNGEA